MWHYYQCPPGLTPGLVPPPRRGHSPPGPGRATPPPWNLRLLGATMFWLFSCCLGPLSRHGNSAPWAYIVVSLQQCSFFLTLRGNFGADSNNFGPCPSHAFRLTELQGSKICYCLMEQIGAASIFINGSNLQRFAPFSWRALPLQKRSVADLYFFEELRHTIGVD